MSYEITADELIVIANGTLDMADALRVRRGSDPKISNEDFMRSFHREMVLRNFHDELLIVYIQLDDENLEKVRETIELATQRMNAAIQNIKEKRENIKVVAKAILFLAAIISGDAEEIISTGISLVSLEEGND